MKKMSIFKNNLKNILCAVFVTALTACSFVNSDDWPLLTADPLWTELAETKNNDVVDEVIVTDIFSEPILSNSPHAATPLLLIDVRVMLDKIERDLPYQALNMAKALVMFNAAAKEDKALYWRGVEIEKSRVNEFRGELRMIEHQIANNDQAVVERQLTNILLRRVEEITPDAPNSLDLTRMKQVELSLGSDLFKNQMVVAANPYAAKAGLEILRRGGSAVDAAIAVETTLSLVEPQSSGIGGGAFLLHFDPNKATTEQLNFYDGRETAPRAATPDHFKSVTEIPGNVKLDAVYGGLSVGVPGALAALKMAHEKHGILPWKEVFAPAIKLAEEGFVVSERMEHYITIDKKLKLVPASRDYFYDQKGEPLKAGHLLKNPKQGAVLRRIAVEGISAFYTGDIAEKIVKAIRYAPNNPGIMELSDLENYKAKERNVICGDYNVYKVCSIPPPSSGGHTMIATLGMLDEFDIDKMQPHSAEAYNIILEAESLAYADRNQYTGDTDFVNVPVQGMINSDYLKSRARLIMPGTSMGRAPYGNPSPKLALDYDKGYVLDIPSTTHISITDKWGHVVSMTATVESMFGSRLMVEGFMLNNELTDFSLTPVGEDGKLVANRVQGGKRPMSSQTPTIVFDDKNRPVLIIGSPGGASIINYVTQTIINALDWDMDMQSAISAPHILSRNGPALVEKGTAAETLIEPLKAMGHDVRAVMLMSGLHGIKLLYDDEGGRTLDGGADPRREGYVAQ